MKKLKKKLILVLAFRALTLPEKLQKMMDIALAHIAKPSYVTLNPLPAAVKTQIEAAQTLYTEREALLEQYKSKTQELHDVEDVLNNTYVDNWLTQTQAATGMTAARAKELGYKVKGDKEKVVLPENSAPAISRISINVHGQHTLYFLNTLSGKVGLPEGVLRIDLYGQTGGTRPADLAALIANGGGYLGQASRGKFVYTFNVTKPGDLEYYIAVYVDKTTKKPIRFSVVESGVLS